MPPDPRQAPPRHRLIDANGGPLGLACWPGPAARTPALLLHGFTGAGADWAACAPALGRPCLAPDLPGHGRSPPDPALGLARLLRRVRALLERLRLRRVHLVGYSLGARLALHLALDHPQRIASLTLIGGTPGLRDPAERAARAAEDAARAAALLAEGAAGFLRAWQRQPLIATQARAPARLRAALDRWRAGANAAGWAAALRVLSPGVLPARWDDLPGLRPPLLLLTGAEDEKFARLAAEMRARVPGARHATVPGAGHAPQLERPRATAALLRAFLDARG